jgi:methylenetetrahydrofolate reductase (NADPH)
MAAPHPVATLDPAPVGLLRGFSIEIPPRDRRGIAAAADHLAAGTDVYLPWVPGETYHRAVAAAQTLRRAGLNPVPHVAARHLASFTQLADFLARLAGEAAARQALVIGGDRDRPVGPFESSLQLLETGLFARHGVVRLGFAAYPEGNPKVARAALDRALDAKLARVRADGIDAYLVSQFCFEAEPILALLRRLRGAGIAAPLRVGLAGPASLTTLMKFALRCGVGNSVRALALRGASIARLLTEADPGPVIDGLAPAIANEPGPNSPGLGVEGIHFFAFGGLTRTVDWVRRADHEPA